MDGHNFLSLEQDFGLSAGQIEDVNRRLIRPDNWQETNVINGNGQKLNIVWRIPDNPKAVVIVSQGRAQSAPEWIEFSDHMVDEGYAFVTYDPQGQGKSYSLNIDRRHHIDNYMMTEVGDLSSVIDVVESQGNLQNLPKALIGHSKGGNTALRHLATGDSVRHQFQAMALISPMTGIQIKPIWLKALRPILVSQALLRGHHQEYAKTQGDLTFERYDGHKRNLSSDPVSQVIQWELFQQDPRIICHGPTWGFLNEALKSCAHLRQPDVVEKIDTPTYWIVGGDEQINDNQSMIDLHARMPKPNSVLKIYEGAQHQVHMEVPKIKDEMYTDLKAFLRKNL